MLAMVNLANVRPDQGIPSQAARALSWSYIYQTYLKYL